MSAVVKWWSRLAAAVSGLALTLVVPVHAWAAAKGVDGVAVEAAKYRRSRRGFGFFPLFGGLCCLFVVAAVVLVFLLVKRNKRRRG